jgi:hypothetical protein
MLNVNKSGIVREAFLTGNAHAESGIVRELFSQKKCKLNITIERSSNRKYTC